MRTALSLLAGVSAASAAACSTPYDPSTQYYTPRTYTPTNAKSFSIRYAPSFKVFNTTVNGVNYITTLSVCGAPLPTPSSLGLGASDVLLSQLSQPITAAGITSTTYVPYLTLSGNLNAIKAVAGPSYFYNPCIRSGVSSGTITDVSDAYGGYDVTNLAVKTLGAQFGGQWDKDSLAAGGNMVMMGEDTEGSALGSAEYVVYMGAFFDAEAAALATFNAQVARYSCAKASIASPSTTSSTSSSPKVLWGYPYPSNPTGTAQRTWYVAGCPGAWYCPLVSDAGGQLLTGAGGATSLSDSQFALLAAQADVFVYTGSDWSAAMAPYLPGGTLATSSASNADPALVSILASLPALANNRVYDILKRGVNAWFEARPSSPDTLLQDLYKVLYPLPAFKAGLTTPTAFLRNVVAEAVAPLPATTLCTPASTYAASGVAGLSSTTSSACTPFTPTSTSTPAYAVIVPSVVVPGVALLAVLVYIYLTKCTAAGSAPAKPAPTTLPISSVEPTIASASV